MKPILLFLILSPILAQAQTRVTTNELSTTTAYNFPATAPVTISSLTTKGDTLFDSETSTASFRGWVDMGFVIVKNEGTGASTITASCPYGYRAVSGSCYETNSQMRGCYGVGASWPYTGWTTEGPSGSTAYKFAIATCARIK